MARLIYVLQIFLSNFQIPKSKVQSSKAQTKQPKMRRIFSHHLYPFLLPIVTRSFSMSTSLPKKVVVVGGGIQGTSVAYHISKASPTTQVQILEAKAPASAASGKGGGFMARSWGDGGPTQDLHHVAFDMYEDLANELGCSSYRKLPVLSVRPGSNNQGVNQARKDRSVGPLMPNWLDGNTGGISAMGYGDDTAQVTPKEFVDKMIEKSGIEVVLGECCGMLNEQSDDGKGKVTGVKYLPRGGSEELVLETDTVVVSAGPWSCAAEDWFGSVDLPMEGVKSTSIVWKKGEDEVDATALFCGEDNRFGTHCK
jgi:glycine/D-amino acid oxidase-like deaminating enzyme